MNRVLFVTINGQRYIGARRSPQVNFLGTCEKVYYFSVLTFGEFSIS